MLLEKKFEWKKVQKKSVLRGWIPGAILVRKAARREIKATDRACLLGPPK